MMSLVLLAILLFLSFYYITNPQRDDLKQFEDAPEVPISQITQGYADEIFEKITALNKMLDQGLITQEEFAQKKQQLLNQL